MDGPYCLECGPAAVCECGNYSDNGDDNKPAPVISDEVQLLKAEVEQHRATIKDADFYIKKLEAQLAAMTAENRELNEYLGKWKDRTKIGWEQLDQALKREELLLEALEAHAKILKGEK